MTYVTTLGITRMCTQETADVYRSIAGELPTAVASGISISHIMPLENTIEIEEDYINFKPFQIKQFFTLYSGILPGDEVHLNSDIWEVRVVNPWYTPDYYHCIVEETK